MFFYRFSCFIPLVTNVTKKSLKSFQDRKLHANQFAHWDLGQKGFRAVFSSHSWDFSSTRLHGVHGAPQGFTRLHGGSGVHSASRRSSRPHRLHGGAALHRTSPLSSVLVTREILVTALVTDLVTRFSPNSYVFL